MNRFILCFGVGVLFSLYPSDLEIFSEENHLEKDDKEHFFEEENKFIGSDEKNSEISTLNNVNVDKLEFVEDSKALVSQNESNQEKNRSEVKQELKKKKTSFFVRGDLLYWIAEESGFDTNFGSGSVFKSVSQGGVQVTEVLEKDTDPSFNWDLGYRIYLGAQFCEDIWGFQGIWTHFQGKGNKNYNNGKWHVRLDQIDIVGNYKGLINQSLFLETLFGLRLAEIYQKLHSTVLTAVVVSNSGTAIDSRVFNDKQKFDGIGPLFGLHADLKLGAGFSFYGTFSGSLLFGRYLLNFDDFENVTEPLTAQYTVSKIEKTMKAFDFDMDLGFGFSWRERVYKEVFITLLAGLENHQYFNQNRIGSNWGDLSFSGAVFSIKLDF